MVSGPLVLKSRAIRNFAVPARRSLIMVSRHVGTGSISVGSDDLVFRYLVYPPISPCSTLRLRTEVEEKKHHLLISLPASRPPGIHRSRDVPMGLSRTQIGGIPAKLFHPVI